MKERKDVQLTSGQQTSCGQQTRCVQLTRCLQLSKRMQMVADMVTKGNVAADIGCDHGFVSIYLIEQGICPRVIAMDVNEGPLLRAKEHIAERALEAYIDVRLSDGIEKLEKKEAESIIIAGMGGKLVMKILSAHMDKVRDCKEIILQPQSELHLVRHFLVENGFVIEQEDMVEEAGKFYPCIRAVWKEEKISYSSLEEWYGPVLLREKHPVLYEYLLKEKDTFTQIVEEIRKNGKQIGEETKENTIQKRLNQIGEAFAYYE